MFARPRFILPGFITKPIGGFIGEGGGGGGDEDELITAPVITSEALLAGDLVNIWDDAGTPKARKADADADREAHGYVLAAVSSGVIATVYFNGINNELSGLTIGADYYLGTAAGEVLEAPGPVDAGDLNQHVGFAISTTDLVFQFNVPTQIGA